MKILIAGSGGLDSSTLIYEALNSSWDFEVVFFNYGQRHLKKESEALDNFLKYFKISDKRIDVNLNFDHVESALLNKDLDVNDVKNDLPSSFVPGRNIIMLTYLASIGYSRGIYNIGIANHKDDFQGYPDCRQDTILSLEKTLTLGLGKEITIVAPFSNLTKTDIARRSHPFILKNSWSCYEGGDQPCGVCKSCLLREEAILNAKRDI